MPLKFPEMEMPVFARTLLKELNKQSLFIKEKLSNLEQSMNKQFLQLKHNIKVCTKSCISIF